MLPLTLARTTSCAGAALALGAALSCSAITQIPQQSCSDNEKCREGFGLGWVCNQDSGLCEEVEENALCKSVYPEDLLTDPDKYPGDTILFATLLDGEGDIQMINSANLAIEQVRTNGLENRAFGMINCSYGNDSDVMRQIDDAKEAARYAVDAYGVVAIIGPGTSSIAEAVYNEVKDEVLIVSPSATSDSLTFIDGTMKSFDNPGLFWRTAPPDSGIAERMASELISSGRTKVALIYKDGAYGSNLADLLNKSLESKGIANPLIARPYSDTGDLGNPMNEIGGMTDVEEIVFIADSNPDVVTFLVDAASRSAMGGNSFATATLMLGDAGFSEANVLAELNQAVKDELVASGRIRGVKPKSPAGPAFMAFSTAYTGAFGESPANNGYTAESYDAAWLAIYGAGWSLYNEGGIEPKGMAKGLHRVSAGKALDEAGVKALASIPSREVLIAQIAGLLKSPIQRMAGVLAAVAEQRGGGEAQAEAPAAA